MYELVLNGLDIQERTPELDNSLVVRRGDEFKLVFGLALQQCEDCFSVLDVLGDFFLKAVSKLYCMTVAKCFVL